MNKTKHTPGPWTCKHHGEWITGRDEYSGEIVIAKTEGAAWAANARLIAAAPELLGALAACLSCLTLDSDLEEDFSAEIAQARAAIAKANGEES